MRSSRGRDMVDSMAQKFINESAPGRPCGASKELPEEDVEDWETGIETEYSVKSVIYVGGQVAPAIGPQSATYKKPSLHTSQLPPPPAPPPPQLPPQSSLHPWDPGYIAHTKTNTTTNNLPCKERPARSEINQHTLAVSTTQPDGADFKSDNRPVWMEENAESFDRSSKDLLDFEFDSDSDSACDVDKWDFGDAPKCPPTKTDTVNGKELTELEALVKRNPGVSVTWLNSLLNQKEASNKSGKNSGSSRNAGGVGRAAEPKLHTETLLFPVPGRAECQRWREALQRSWGLGGLKVTSDLLMLINQCFTTVSNPYATALYLMESAADCRNVKASTLSHQVAREFSKWIRNNPQSAAILKKGGEALQVYAFYVGTRFHQTAFDFIVKAFQLSIPPNHFLVPLIQPFIQLSRFKEACQCISKLQLHEHFNTEQMVFPLILQDKGNLIEQYVFQHRKQQVELLQLLDRLCEDNVNLNKLAEESGVKDIRYNKLDRKGLGKLAVRLMKLYQIPQDVCPNVDRRRNLSALRYTFYKFYIEQSVSRETWRELVAPSVGDNPWLQERLLDELLTYNDVTEAVWWVHRCQMPVANLPLTVQHELEITRGKPNQVAVGADSDDWDDELVSNDASFMPLELGLSEVRIVDTRPDFIAAIHNIVENATIVGLDAEWRPSLGRGTRVALLQMATPTRVYLLDIIRLCNDLVDADWVWFGEQIFLNTQITKLGYGFQGDVQMLSASIPSLREFILKAERMVEMEKLHKQIRKNPESFKSNVAQPCPDSPPPSGRRRKPEERGLSGMVRHCLGRPLDKAEQMSDWEKRPLRRAQVIYAALDAFVLIELYLHVVERAGALPESARPGAPPPPGVSGVVLGLQPARAAGAQAGVPRRSRMEKRQARVAERTAEQTKVDSQAVPPPISPSQLAVIVDTMVQGVGRYLRSCGVDTRILDSSEDHDAALDIALRENRVILTCGQPYLSLSTQVPEGMCYKVSTNEKARQQAIDVLDHFNVKVTEADIFSRCQACNGTQYLHIAPSEMRRAFDRHAELLSKHDGPNPAPAGPRPGMAGPRLTTPGPRPTTGCPRPVCPTHFSSVYDTTFTWDSVQMADLTVAGGVPLQLGSIPRAVTHQVAVFYVCASCGKVFWEGKHFSDVCEQFDKVLSRPKLAPRDALAETPSVSLEL